MKRIWNALRYGDSTTRKYIGSVILFSVLAIVIIIISGILVNIYLFIFAMLIGVAAILISQSFTLVNDDFVAEINQEGKKDTVRAVSVKRDKVLPDKQESEEIVSDRKKSKEETWDKEEVENEARFNHYNEQVLKNVKRKNRVKKDHRPIIIDYSRSYHIKECPAFIWRVHNKVFLLLLEKEPRKISISRELIKHMGYESKVHADCSKEYVAFNKENLITSVFKEYLPDYYDSKAENTNLKYKNCYTIYPDIRISNRSAADVMDLLCLNFMPKDKVTESDKLNGFFKRVYAANILYKDKVYGIAEYKDAVEKALREMCYAEIPEREFNITLENLMKGRLISQEYADYYIDMKKKISAKRVENI